MKKPIKYLLYILIIPVIIFIAFFITTRIGNPLTRITAYKEIKDYAKTEFKDLNYTLDNIQYDAMFNMYCIKLNIPNSEDKDFYINYKDGEIFDERTMVTMGLNISNRIQPLLNDIKYDEPVKKTLKDNLNFCFMTLYNEEWNTVEPDITLEDFLNKYSLQLSIHVNNPINNKNDIINKLKQEYANQGINIKKITIA